MRSIPTPSLEDLLKKYKRIARSISKEKNLLLTQAQHKIAREAGFSDWQKFNYFFKGVADVVVGLDKEEWSFLSSITNKYSFDMKEDLNSLMEIIIRYDLNPENMSFIDKNKFKYLSQKLQSLGILKRKAVLATCLYYSNKPFFEEHKTILEASVV